MMHYDEGELADHRPCAGIRADLKMCLLKSDCCKIERKLPKDCLKEKNCPPECLALQNTFFECKRSLLDNRQRFRGRKGY
ncbi:cytochrome c oxidase assembly factor 5 [Melanaphis sacchari]|uniref:cytochrome c oxidase assembly factor 5 n=1 Tax=Melanaphis sacchari TaxID=742174 RepID=UPI000DC12DF4|nr:cytochrome c oxidase assembly factor 5 [Melanaphis sacchari]XP_025198719.1 cytochrome c oxidase assembly factor 5 [Melanaphis sacchari]XP_025198725.1 cytochrome c oxidase assembly factor 5 [Melanaphis sacchari]XP_025198732.1 cytochrome c oxidase assembly factor 5 [Melanaphis sacchari]